MSDTITPAAASPAPLTPPIPSEPAWAKPAISIIGLVIFAVAFVIAYLSKDGTSLAMMMGAAIGIGNLVFNYYLGSSSGSTKKTEIAAVSAEMGKAP